MFFIYKQFAIELMITLLAEPHPGICDWRGGNVLHAILLQSTVFDLYMEIIRHGPKRKYENTVPI